MAEGGMRYAFPPYGSCKISAEAVEKGLILTLAFLMFVFINSL
jgi:hypothetical protein